MNGREAEQRRASASSTQADIVAELARVYPHHRDLSMLGCWLINNRDSELDASATTRGCVTGGLHNILTAVASRATGMMGVPPREQP